MNSSDKPKETSDPLIDEVRAVRKAICDQFGNDVEKIAKYVREIGDQHRRRSTQDQAPAPSASEGGQDG